MAMPARPRRHAVQSAAHGAELLKALARLGPGATLSALSEAVGMPPAKAHRYTQALIASGLAAQGPATGLYQLGPEMVAIGLAALGRIDVLAAATAQLAALRDAAGHTCFIAVWGNHGATVVRVMPAAGAVTLVTAVGAVLPLLGSATGLVFAAHLDPAEIAAAGLDSAASPLDQRGPLASRLAAIRAAGCARVHGLLMPGVDAVAVPLPGLDGRVAAVLTALGPQGGFDADAITRHLHHAASRITAGLGLAGPHRERSS